VDDPGRGSAAPTATRLAGRHRFESLKHLGFVGIDDKQPEEADQAGHTQRGASANRQRRLNEHHSGDAGEYAGDQKQEGYETGSNDPFFFADHPRLLVRYHSDITIVSHVDKVKRFAIAIHNSIMHR
jgi:hypothetical protein